MSFGLSRQHDPWNWDVNDNADSQEWQQWDNHPPGPNQHVPKDPGSASVFDNLASNVSQSSNKPIQGPFMDPPNIMWDMNNQLAYDDRMPNQRPPVPQESQPTPVDNSRPPSQQMPVFNSFQSVQNHPQPPFAQNSQPPMPSFPPPQPHRNDQKNEVYNQRPGMNSASNPFPPEVSQTPNKNPYSKQLPRQPSSYSSINPISGPTVTSNNQHIPPQLPPNIPPPQVSASWETPGMPNVENLENPSYNKPIENSNRVHQNMIQSNRQGSVSPAHSAGSLCSQPPQVDNTEIAKPVNPQLFGAPTPNSFADLSRPNDSSNYQAQFPPMYNQPHTREELKDTSRNLQQPANILNSFNSKNEEHIVRGNQSHNFQPEQNIPQLPPMQQSERTPDSQFFQGPPNQRIFETPQPQNSTSSDQFSRVSYIPPSSMNATVSQFQQMSLNEGPSSANAQNPFNTQQNTAYSMDFNSTPNVQNPPMESSTKPQIFSDNSSSNNTPFSQFFQGSTQNLDNSSQVYIPLKPEPEPFQSMPPSHQSDSRPSSVPVYYNNNSNSSAPTNSRPSSTSGIQMQQSSGEHVPQEPYVPQVKPPEPHPVNAPEPQAKQPDNTDAREFNNFNERNGANIVGSSFQVDQSKNTDSSAFNIGNENNSQDVRDSQRPRSNEPPQQDAPERKKLSKDDRQGAVNKMYNSGRSSIEMPVSPVPDQAQGGPVASGQPTQRPSSQQWKPEQAEHSKLTSNRDEYLETGNLSAPHDKSKQPTPQPSTDMTEEGDDPPPGLHRMVTGQVCDMSLGNPIDGSRVPSPGANYGSVNYSTRDSSTPLSNNGNDVAGRHMDDGSNNIRPQGRLVQGQSIGEDNDSVREIPGEANPSNGRVVVGFMGPDSQQQQPELSAPRDPSKDLDRGRNPPNRMVVGDFRHPRNDRNDSDGMNPPEYYNSYRGRHRHHRDSPDYLSDEDYEDLRRRDGYHRRDRRPRDRGDRDPDDMREPYRDDRRYRPRYDYGREEDYYYSRSRPSSRSGSDYRRVNDYNMSYPAPGHHMRHGYYPGGPPGYPRDYSEFSKRDWTEFCDNYRRADPVGYAHWYYSQYMRRANVSTTSYSNDRASVHSGQSSTHAPGPLPKEGMDDEVATLDDSIANEYNPMLYSTAHIRGNFDSHGRVIAVDPHYPLDRQTASVRILHGGYPPCDAETEEFLMNPGPFVVGSTNKSIVLSYLKNTIDKSMDEGEKLLCSLFHLMIKLNGIISGSDIAELLLEDYKTIGAEYSYDERIGMDGSNPVLAVQKYRQHLLEGNKTGALEWAMEVGLWGHAFYLASKLDEKTHSNVLVRFSNSIPSTDPIQSLYQLLSGIVPQATTSCSDPKWADWRPHLAMLLSNQHSSNPDFIREAVVTLAESLGSKGRLFESHFCYVVAQLDNRYPSLNERMPLIGIDISNINNNHTPCRPIMLTMCYEFAKRLSQPSFYLPSLLKYKLLLTTRLIDFGRQKIATQYIETLANELIYFNVQDVSLLSSLIDLGTHLKPFNPNITQTGFSLPDPDWLITLTGIYNNLIRGNNSSNYDNRGDVVHHSTPILKAPQTYSQTDGMVSMQDISSVPRIEQPPMYTPTSIPLIPVETNQEESKMEPPMPAQFSEHLPNEQHHILKPIANYNADMSPVHNPLMPPVQEDHHHHVPSHPPPMMGGPHEMPPLDRPEMPPRPEPVVEKPTQGFNYYSQTDEMFKAAEPKPNQEKPPTSNGSKKEGQSDKAGEKGWFGGILKRLNPLQRNQMHLPDDSNPSIVWDEDKKKWVNLDGGDDPGEQILPPPKMSQVPQHSAPAGGNLYKLQKGRNFKSNYVNVLNINSRPGDKNSGPNSLPMAQPNMHGPPSDSSFLGGPLS